MNVFTVTFDQFNASLNKSISLLKKKYIYIIQIFYCWMLKSECRISVEAEQDTTLFSYQYSFPSWPKGLSDFHTKAKLFHMKSKFLIIDKKLR